MMRFIRKKVWLMLILAVVLFPFAGRAALAQEAGGAPVTVEEMDYIEIYEDAEGRQEFGFTVVGGESQQPGVSAEVLPREGEVDLIWLGVVLTVLAAAGGAAVFLLKKKAKSIRILAGVLAVIFLGGGIFGFLFRIPGSYEPYRYIAAVPTDDPAPDAESGLTTAAIRTRRIVSDFEFGLENRYDRIYSVFKHYWSATSPEASYETVDAEEEMLLYGATEGEPDNSNYWYVLPGAGGEIGTVTATYRLDHSGYGNYLDTSIYDSFRIVFSAENEGGRSVNLTVKLQTATSDGLKTYELGTYEGNSGEKVVLTFPTTVLPAAERRAVSRILFETSNAEVGSWQRNDLYYAEFVSSVTPRLVQTLDDVTYESEYYGTMVPTRYGLYSGSAMYDSEDGLWRWWGGGGIPEGVASDNIWYLETEDPALGWTKQQRIVINDPNQILHEYNMSPGQGGDPSVIKVDGVFYMYFTGLPKETRDGTWNKVMLATSTDGIHFDLVDQPIIDVPVSDGRYGAGAPSVIYKDEMFYMYYFNTTESGGMLATSADGYTFEAPRAIRRNTAGGPADVTYVPSIDKWVLYDGQLAFSDGDDGVNFTYPTDTIAQQYDGISQPAHNFSVYQGENGLESRMSHSGNFIENEHGIGFETMFICYAYEDLQNVTAGLNMDFRELEWSRITFRRAG